MALILTPTPVADHGVPVNHITDIVTFVNAIDARAWQSYTPTWTNGTLGNGVLEGRFWQLGKDVQFRITLIWGSSTTASTNWTFTFPVTAFSSRSFSVCFGEYVDVSASSSGPVRGRLTSGSTFAVLSGASQLGSTSPITWATGDELHLTGVYEAA